MLVLPMVLTQKLPLYDYILVIQQGLQKNGVVGFVVCVVRAALA